MNSTMKDAAKAIIVALVTGLLLTQVFAGILRARNNIPPAPIYTEATAPLTESDVAMLESIRDEWARANRADAEHMRRHVIIEYGSRDASQLPRPLQVWLQEIKGGE